MFAALRQQVAPYVLRRVKREFTRLPVLFVILDDYGRRNRPELQRWLQRNPRFVAYFVPGGASWSDLVQSTLASQSAPGRYPESVNAVSEAILHFLRGSSLGPFVWTATIESLLGQATEFL